MNKNKIPQFHNPLRSESEAFYDKKMGNNRAIENSLPKTEVNADGEKNLENESLATTGAIFGKRLDLLNDYLLREADLDTKGDKPFSAFLAFKKISPEEFSKDLPNELKTIPDDFDDVLHYAGVLHDYYTNLYVQHLKEEAGHSADGIMTYDQPLLYADGTKCEDCAKKHEAAGYPNLSDDVKTYEKHNTINADGKKHCCGKCAEAAEHAADGSDPWADEVEDNGEAVYAKAGFMNASGSICPLPPIRPLAKRGSGGLGGKFKKQIAANWATYDKNRAKYDACIKNRKEAGGKSKALHILNLSNPLFALSRGAYLGLIKGNVGAWATTWNRMLNDPDQSSYKKAYAVFYNVGGLENKLKDAINAGKNKKAKFRRKNGHYNAEPASIGASAALTAAAGIIAAVSSVLVSFINAKGRTAAERAPADAEADDAALRGDPSAPGGDGGGNPDNGPASDEGLGNSMSNGMKWVIGLSVGIPLAVAGFFGIRYLVKN